VTPVVASDRTDTTSCSGGWQQCPFVFADRHGTDLFTGLRDDVSSAWAGGSVSTYTGPWNLFVQFCNERQPPLSPLPASAVVVALFLYLRLSGASSYSLVRTASAAINYMHEINLHPSPTKGRLPALVRKLAKRRLGLDPKNVKAPFKWSDIGTFVQKFCRPGTPPVRHMFAVLAAVTFAGFCRPGEPIRLLWRNVGFTATHVTLDLLRRKNRIYRETKVRIGFNPSAACCPASLLQRWSAIRFGDTHPDSPVFPTFNGRLMGRGEDRVVLSDSACLSDRQMRLWLAKWLAPHMGLTEKEFQQKFGMKSFRSGGASAAGAANIPFEIWGSHGGWQTREAQLRYMEIDLAQALSVSTTVTGGPLPRALSPESDSESSDDAAGEVSE
jgi:hypothetical protein